ncbi:hypothetical protein BDY24DRAFT_393817 [Mrakia frigida]|uniref:uncharacterized protein n=1 Tax=Mrakia frigida TaxID=29902 RepID=UPI003FCBFC81
MRLSLSKTNLLSFLYLRSSQSSPQIQTHPFALSLHSLPDPTTPSLLSASGGFTPGGSRYSFHPSSPFAMGLAVSDVRSTPSPGGERGFGWGIGGGGGAGGRG